jgi:hypothetical protein
MEPESPLPCSQEPSTGPYPETDPIQTSHPTSLNIHLTLSSCTGLVLPSCLFASGFSIEVLHAFLFFPMHATCQIIRQSSRLFVTFCNELISVYGEELLDPRQSLKQEVHPLSSVHDCLLNIFGATLLHPEHEDAVCSGDKGAVCIRRRVVMFREILKIC